MPKYFKRNLLTPPHLLNAPHSLPKPELELPAEAASLHPIIHPEIPELQLNGHPDDPIHDLVVWQAPSRPYRKKDRSFFTWGILLVILVGLLGPFFDASLLGLALAALLFVVVVLNFFPPEEIEYRISTQGIIIDHTHFYHWHDLDSFYLERKDQNIILYVVTYYRFPSLLMLPLGPVTESEIKQVIGEYLPFHEVPPKSLIDKWGDFLQKYFSLENTH